MKRVAVIEDNPDNRLLVSAILEEEFEVDDFEEGESGLAAFAAGRLPDVLLLDISLPVLDGTQVLARIRDSEALRGIPVIALTAHAMAGDREKYLGLGFDDYVTKPIIDEDILLDAIRRLVARGGSTR